MAKLKQVDPNKFIGDLRGEVGEVIQSWIIMEYFQNLARPLQTNDVLVDMNNTDLAIYYSVINKYKEDIISRLSELGSKDHARVNFNTAAAMYRTLQSECYEFEKFITNNSFKSRRNEYISHKKLVRKYEDERSPYRIEKFTILRAIAFCLRLMKKFDLHFYGPEIIKQWHIMREKRYDLTMPGSVKYRLLPHSLPLIIFSEEDK